MPFLTLVLVAEALLANGGIGALLGLLLLFNSGRSFNHSEQHLRRCAIGDHRAENSRIDHAATSIA